ncbi:hypothetical protein Syun_001023 [Stephania yunnanensis]|uniref:Uncharacterized protein n=1 Tax=Stephania yunnanensis TaxID=152371 RepID=A0AAP0LD06_9MAGN
MNRKDANPKQPEVVLIVSSSSDELEEEPKSSNNSNDETLDDDHHHHNRMDRNTVSNGVGASCCFPANRIRKIIRSEGADFRTTQETMFLINKATVVEGIRVIVAAHVAFLVVHLGF